MPEFSGIYILCGMAGRLFSQAAAGQIGALSALVAGVTAIGTGLFV